jgi:IclR family mhp operon transcriptional activator
MVGRGRPLLTSAVGRAVLAAAAPGEREMMLEMAERLHGKPRPKNLDATLKDVAARGYAWTIGGAETHISAIALPIRGAGGVMGAVNIVFFRRASTPEEIAEKHLGDLRQCVAAIEAGLRHAGICPDQPSAF